MKITKPFKIALGATIAVIAISAMIGSATEEVATEAETVTVASVTVQNHCQPSTNQQAPTNQPTNRPTTTNQLKTLTHQNQ